jgi:hypothetical protein
MTFAGHEMDCLELKAELLRFLTLSEIFTFHSNGAWLRTDHLVEAQGSGFVAGIITPTGQCDSN